MIIRPFLTLSLLCVSYLSYAAPLSIVPKSPLPTTIFPGGVVHAYYTVTNNTCSEQMDIFVKELPLNVTQVTHNPSIPDLCGFTFTLQACQTTGSSCTLELEISAPVQAGPDDLLICLNDGISCACTDYPLDVNYPVDI